MKTKLKTLSVTIANALSCGHAAYGYIALTYALGCLQMIDKTNVEQALVAIYLAITLRP